VPCTLCPTVDSPRGTVPEPPDDLLEQLPDSGLEIRAMKRSNGRLPAKLWYEELTEKEQGKVGACAKTWYTSQTTSRPAGGPKFNVVGGSSHRLYELRPTPHGSRGRPPLRMLVLLEGKVVWVALGLTKTGTKLRPQDIQRADRITSEWKAGRETDQPKKAEPRQ
jgi:hypothetical protein